MVMHHSATRTVSQTCQHVMDHRHRHRLPSQLTHTVNSQDLSVDDGHSSCTTQHPRHNPSKDHQKPLNPPTRVVDNDHEQQQLFIGLWGGCCTRTSAFLAPIVAIFSH